MNQPTPTLATFLDTATQTAVIGLDPQGLIKAFSKGAEVLLGYFATEVVDTKSLWQLTSLTELKAFASHLSAEYQTSLTPEVALTYEALRGKPSIRQWTFVRKNGRLLKGTLSLSATFDADGHLNGLLAFILPVDTSATSSEVPATRQQSEQGLLQTLAIAGIGSWAYELKTRQINFSEQLFRVYEISDEAEKERLRTYPKEIAQFVHPSDAKYVARMARLLMERKETIQIDYQIIARNGQTKHLVAAAQFCFDAAGEPEKIIGTIQDITEQKQKEQELTDAKFQAEQITTQKQQFLSTMSHEIRTPLNAIIGITRLLRQNNPRPDQLEDLRMLQFSSENLLQLANDILDFSKLDVGKATFEEVEFNLRDLLSSIRHSFSYSILDKSLRIHSRLDAQLPDTIMGDPIRLSQVMNNLLGNAIKFTETGSITIEVLLDAEDDQTVTLGFSVTDTGIGIPEDRLEFIFESFVQASNDISHKYGGSGLGLAITKRLLESQGSRIYVESAPGRGSRFFFHLRFKKSPRNQPVAPVRKAQPALPAFGRLHVLLVEDNTINQMLAKKFLNQWNIEPDLASNGIEALEKVRKNAYDIILMDLQMPVMDGYQATAAIRQMEGNPNQPVPVIALTAATLHEIVNRAQTAGITDFMVKPFEPVALHRLIEQYVTNKQLSTPPPANPAESPASLTAEELAIHQKLEKIPEMTLQEQVTFFRASIQLFTKFQAAYQKALADGDPDKLTAAVHPMKVVFDLLDARQVMAEVETGYQLMGSRQRNPQLINRSVGRMDALCEVMVSVLQGCLEDLSEKVS